MGAHEIEIFMVDSDEQDDMETGVIVAAPAVLSPIEAVTWERV